jgi:hypothetical protein
MAHVNTYDIQGYRVDTDYGDVDPNDRLFGRDPEGILFVADPNANQFVAYFRVRESFDAAAQQYYIEFSPPSGVNPIDKITVLIEKWADQQDISLTYDHPRMNVFSALKSWEGISPPGSEGERRLVEQLADKGDSEIVGVADAESAIGLLLDLGVGFSVGIVGEDHPSEPLDMVDITISIEQVDGIKPIGPTVRSLVMMDTDTNDVDVSDDSYMNVENAVGDDDDDDCDDDDGDGDVSGSVLPPESRQPDTAGTVAILAVPS